MGRGSGPAEGRGAGYLVDRRVLPERQVPEAAADLVSALADCGQGREGKSTGMRTEARPHTQLPRDPLPPAGTITLHDHRLRHAAVQPTRPGNTGALFDCPRPATVQAGGGAIGVTWLQRVAAFLQALPVLA